MKFTTILLCALAAYTLPGLAEANRTYIPVGKAATKKTILAFPTVRKIAKTPTVMARQVHKVLENDLVFMDLFKFLPTSAYLENTEKAGLLPNTFRMSDWTSAGVEILIKSQLQLQGNSLTYEIYVYDTFRNKQILAKRYVAEKKDLKTLAHTAANDIVQTITGSPGIFLTKIAMTCNRTGKKEIYVMNFDGSNVRQITRHRSISFSPAWSPDSSKIAYSVYTRHKRNIKNIDLYEFDFKSNTIRLLSNRKGINSGASYSPDGKRIALTMSFLGNPEIFSLHPDKKKASRLTKSFGFDVDPIWNADGSQLAFVSSRAGRPMVYKMNANGTGVQRLTYAGRYNATPTWSPKGNKIAFAGWKKGKFDIYMMNADGTKIERLTKNQGNNEDPYFSPDGNFIAFSSNRTGRKNIYVMNTDGTFAKRLTYGLGDCEAPKWSLSPKP